MFWKRKNEPRIEVPDYPLHEYPLHEYPLPEPIIPYEFQREQNPLSDRVTEIANNIKAAVADYQESQLDTKRSKRL
ncbi:MAG: hypothetical protein FWG69_05610 [Oscillospiraceae bacterium]|nr:hypothetical protein [Oscillospiraceae bacterium]